MRVNGKRLTGCTPWWAAKNLACPVTAVEGSVGGGGGMNEQRRDGVSQTRPLPAWPFPVSLAATADVRAA